MKKDRNAENPNWQEDLLAKVRQNRNGKRGVQAEDIRLQVHVYRKFNARVQDAADALGMTQSGFVRRAVAVITAHVTGTPLADLLAESPVPWASYRNQLMPRGSTYRDDGKGIENLCPHPGCDGDHLRVR